MGHIKMVLRFGWPYLKRYWVRLVLGVLMGLLFGLTNASFVWATKTIMERLESPEIIAAKAQTHPAKVKRVSELTQRVDRVVDPWLPKMGRNLDWRQVLGGILFMPLLFSFRATTSYSSSYCIG